MSEEIFFNDKNTHKTNNEDVKKTTNLTDNKKIVKNLGKQKLSQALRENLLRRKNSTKNPS